MVTLTLGGSPDGASARKDSEDICGDWCYGKGDADQFTYAIRKA